MKKLVLVALIIVSGLSVVKAQSPCSPNPIYTDSASGYYPKVLPPLVTGQPYYEVVTLVTPHDTILNGIAVSIKATKLFDINQLPAGFTYTPNYTVNGYWLNINNGLDSIWMSTTGCFSISADANAVNNALALNPSGNFSIQYITDVLIKGNPIPSTYTWVSTLGSPPYGASIFFDAYIGSADSCSYYFYVDGDTVLSDLTDYAGLPSTGGSYDMAIASSFNCNWTLSGGCNWISANPTSGASGDITTFSYQTNTTGAPRYCDFFIGNRIYHITQLSDSCSVAMGIPDTIIGPLEETVYVYVDAADSCYWSIINRAYCDWMDISPTSGTGSDTLIIHLNPNTEPGDRQCDLNINGTVLTLTQQSTVGINENTLNSRIKIYPNPANDFVTIQNPDINGKTTLSIYTVAGQLLQQTPLTTTSQQVNTAALANGVYVFTVQNDAGITARKKVVISR